MEQLWQVIVPLWQPLLLLVIANGAPIIVRNLFGSRLDRPIDGGYRFIDGRPLLGPTKSWRGVVGAILSTSFIALVLGYAWWLGALLALLAMAGDAIASFIKRRLDIPPHGRSTGLDQLPEALLPLWVLQGPLGLSGIQIAIGAFLFMVLERLISPLLFRCHIRLRPY